MGNTIRGRGLAVLGSTGSIGTQTLDIARAFPRDFSVVALAAGRSHRLLEQQLREFRPALAYCEGSAAEKAFIAECGSVECPMERMVADDAVDIVVAATTGDVAIPATFAAIDAGKRIALANKETVVIAGNC